VTELETLRDAVQRLNDRAELHDLVNRYAMAVDDHDLAAVRDMYTADACFARRGRVASGREEVLRSLEAQMRRYGPMIHTPHSLIIDWVDADHARGRAAGHAELALDGQLIFACYRYDDCYRRETPGWRFSRRELRFIYGVPASGFPQVFADQNRLRWPDEPATAADLPETLPGWQLAGRQAGPPATGDRS
jgi:ketosteroid isomerase-like protein